MSRFPNPVEDEITGPIDDLDQARYLLDALDDAEANHVDGVSYSLKAIAHTLLWHAEQMRDYKRAQDEWVRRQRNNIPPAPPFPLPGYPGF